MPGLSMGGNSRTPQSTPPISPETALRAAQTIYLTLMIGLLLGGGVLAFMGLSHAGGMSGGAGAAGGTGGAGGSGTGGAAGPGATDIFPIVVPIVSAVGLAFVLVAPGWLARAAQKRWEARADDDAAMHRVYGGFVQLVIMQAAMLEGPGLLGAVVTYLSGNIAYLAAPAIAVIFLAVLFPRTSRIERWIDDVTGRPPTGPAVARPQTDDEAA